MYPEANSESYNFTIDGRNGTYVAYWPELRIRANVVSVELNRDKDLSAEVRWSSARPTSNGHLLSGKVTLLSIQSKQTMARSLASRDNSIDWGMVIEQFCYSIEEKERTGEKESILTRIDVLSREKYLIDPLIELNNVSVIFGEPGSGKSWFALYLALLADEGLSTNNLTVAPSNVLYLDWETSRDELRARMTMLRNGLGREGDGSVWYRAQHMAVGKDKRRIMEMILEHDINFVIVDSVGAASSGEVDSANSALDIFGELRSMGEDGGVTALCIDHVNKSGDWFGSIFKLAEARRVFHARRAEQQTDNNSISFGLFNVKSNNGPLISPLGFEISFPSPDNVIIGKQSIQDTSLEEHLSIQSRIVNLFKKINGTMTPAEIAEELGKNSGHISKELSMGNKKYPPLFYNENGHWGLQSWKIPIEPERGNDWLQIQ